jgi:hypothetical protein
MQCDYQSFSFIRLCIHIANIDFSQCHIALFRRHSRIHVGFFFFFFFFFSRHPSIHSRMTKQSFIFKNEKMSSEAMLTDIDSTAATTAADVDVAATTDETGAAGVAATTSTQVAASTTNTTNTTNAAANTGSGAGGVVTLEDKQRLAAQINDLSMTALGGVAEILMRRVPDLKEHAGFEIRLDLESVDAETLKELELFVKADVSARAVSAVGGAGAGAGAAAAHAPTSPSEHVQKKARTHSPMGGAAAAATPGSAKTSKKEQTAAKKAEQNHLKTVQKTDVVAGSERLLRAAAHGLSSQELLFAGTDQGLFHITAHKDALKFVEDTLKAETKLPGVRVFSALAGGKFGLREWTLLDDERRNFAEQRAAHLALIAPCANPATRDQSQLLKAKFIHEEMAKHPAHWMYAVPVDPVALGIPDYPTIITHPMDNGTVKKRLEDGYYKSFEEYKADVDLVWANATRYNPPGHDVHEYALQIRALFYQLVDQFLNTVYAPPVAELPPPGAVPPPLEQQPVATSFGVVPPPLQQATPVASHLQVPQSPYVPPPVTHHHQSPPVQHVPLLVVTHQSPPPPTTQAPPPPVFATSPPPPTHVSPVVPQQQQPALVPPPVAVQHQQSPPPPPPVQQPVVAAVPVPVPVPAEQAPVQWGGVAAAGSPVVPKAEASGPTHMDTDAAAPPPPPPQ